MFRSHTDIKRCKADGDTPSGPVEKGYKCDLCDSEWLTETDVDIHRKKAHFRELMTKIKSDESNICLTCLRDQGSSEALVEHIKTKHLLSSPNAHRIERETFICDNCNNIFFNKMMLEAHLKYVHGSKTEHSSKVPCPKCRKNITVKKLWFHFCCHHINIISTCQICFLDCESMKQLAEHLKTHQCYYSCEICGFITNKDRHFENHIMKHKNRVKSVKKLGGRRFFSPAPFMGPWKYVREPGIKGLPVHDVYICVLCREICANDSEMDNHIYIDHAPETEVKKKPMCSCGEEFFNMVLLKHHIFKLKGDHKLVDDSDFGKLLAEETDKTVMEETNEYYNYEIVVNTTGDETADLVVPLSEYNEEGEAVNTTE